MPLVPLRRPLTRGRSDVQRTQPVLDVIRKRHPISRRSTRRPSEVIRTPAARSSARPSFFRRCSATQSTPPASKPSLAARRCNVSFSDGLSFRSGAASIAVIYQDSPRPCSAAGWRSGPHVKSRRRGKGRALCAPRVPRHCRTARAARSWPHGGRAHGQQQRDDGRFSGRIRRGARRVSSSRRSPTRRRAPPGFDVSVDSPASISGRSASG